MSWELVLPTGTRALNISARQTGGASYPLNVSWDDAISDVQIESESAPSPDPLVLVGRLALGGGNPLLDYDAFISDVQAATHIRYYPDGGTTYWERELRGPISIEVLRLAPNYLRYRLELAVVGPWLENGVGTATRDWL